MDTKSAPLMEWGHLKDYIVTKIEAELSLIP
jgi:hypothetical protein